MGPLVTVVTLVIGLVLLHFYLRSRTRRRKGQGGGEGDSFAPSGDVHSHPSSRSYHACEHDAASGDGGCDGGGDGGGGD